MTTNTTENKRISFLSDCYTSGQYSDVTLRAFEIDYKLHKIVLSQSAYFKTMFDPNWDNCDGKYQLNFDEDPHITKDSFELVLRRLYYDEDLGQEEKNLKGFITLASFLGLSDFENTV